MASTPTVMGSTSPSDEQVADDSDVGKSSKEETARAKSMEVKEWTDSTSLDDVVIGADDWVQLGKTDEQKTRLKSIKGRTTTQLTVMMLKKFCAKHGIGGYKDKPKYILCELSACAAGAKDLEGNMYPEVNAVKDTVSVTGTTKKDNAEEEKTAKKTSNKKKAAKTKPQAVRQEGTLYRVINTFFLQEVRHLTTKIGNQPTARALDKREFLHKDTFEKLAKIYNDSSREDLNKLSHPHDFFVDTKVAFNVASNFDALTAHDFSQILSFINSHYKDCIRKSRKSGSHGPFQNYVKTMPFLFAYYLSLAEAPVELQNLAQPKCPEGVFRESTETLKKENEDSNTKNKKPRKTTAGHQNTSTQYASSLQEMSNVRFIVLFFHRDTLNSHYVSFFLTLRLPKSARSFSGNAMVTYMKWYSREQISMPLT